MLRAMTIRLESGQELSVASEKVLKTSGFASSFQKTDHTTSLSTELRPDLHTSLLS